MMAAQVFFLTVIAPRLPWPAPPTGQKEALLERESAQAKFAPNRGKRRSDPARF